MLNYNLRNRRHPDITIGEIANGYKVVVGGQPPEGIRSLFADFGQSEENEFFMRSFDEVVIFLCRWFIAEQFMADSPSTPRNREEVERAEAELDQEIRAKYSAVWRDGGMVETTGLLTKPISRKIFIK